MLHCYKKGFTEKKIVIAKNARQQMKKLFYLHVKQFYSLVFFFCKVCVVLGGFDDWHTI